MSAPRPDAVWDDSRCAELQSLEKLLNEIVSINSGSHCLERIARCIKLAEELEKYDYRAERPSFRHFLTHLAIADRFPPAAGEGKG